MHSHLTFFQATLDSGLLPHLIQQLQKHAEADVQKEVRLFAASDPLSCLLSPQLCASLTHASARVASHPMRDPECDTVAIGAGGLVRCKRYFGRNRCPAQFPDKECRTVVDIVMYESKY